MEYSRIVYFFQTHTNTQCRRPIQEVRDSSKWYVRTLKESQVLEKSLKNRQVLFTSLKYFISVS